MTSLPAGLPRWACWYFRFHIWWCHSLETVQICKPNFIDMSQSTAGFKKQFRHIVILLPVLTSTYHRHAMGCIVISNFIKIRPPTVELWRHIDLQPGLGDVALFRTSVYMHSRFRRDNLVHTTKSAILEFFRFRYDYVTVNCISFWIKIGSNVLVHNLHTYNS